jgi:hypothetical protein
MWRPPIPQWPQRRTHDEITLRAIGTIASTLPSLKQHSTYKVWNDRLTKLEAIADILQAHKRPLLRPWGGCDEG